jgi:hypothetical protein
VSLVRDPQVIDAPSDSVNSSRAGEHIGKTSDTKETGNDGFSSPSVLLRAISGVVGAMLAHLCARDVNQTSMAEALLDGVYDGIFE